MSEEQGSESAVSRSQSIKEDEMAKEKEAPRKVSRRGFVKGAAAVAGAGALASCAPAPTTAPTTPPEAAATTAPAASPTPVPESWDYEADVVVAGAGNGGLSAAIAAAQEGAKVIVVEISSTTGGGSSYSGQQIHASGIKTYDEYLERTQGLHDPVLGKVYFETFQQYKLWLVDIGADVSVDPVRPAEGTWPGDFVMGAGRADDDPEGARKYFDSLESIFEAAGGTLLLKTAAKEILTDAQGMIVGLKAEGPGGFVKIKANAVILACGGFQSSPEMRQKYLGREADLGKVMGTPYNLGDGLRMAKALGASCSGGFSTFSGGSTPARPYVSPLEDVEEYEKAGFPPSPGSKSQLHQTYSDALLPGDHILVNVYGKRFVDEKAVYPRSNHSILRQPQGKAYGVFDGAMWEAIKDEFDPRAGITSEEKLAFQTERGAVTVIGDTISELADKLGEEPTPVHKANFLKTIAEYNAAVDSGKEAELEVARMGTGVKIETPPFYARPVTAQPYANFGGLAINEYAQVLDDSQRKPIPGLYACPPTAGGVMRSIYTGMIACAGTFGYIAGKNAANL